MRQSGDLVPGCGKTLGHPPAQATGHTRDQYAHRVVPDPSRERICRAGDCCGRFLQIVRFAALGQYSGIGQGPLNFAR